MPSVNYSSDDYKDCLECLQNLYDTFSCYGTVLFLGDFNCDIHQTKCNDDRSKSLSLFLETTQMSACPLEGCYTFRPTNKILDYVITDTYQHELITCNKIIDEDICVVSDHLPIYTLLKCEVIMYSLPQGTNVAWNRCTNEQLISYQQKLEDELHKLETPVNCTASGINSFYDSIVKSIHVAAESTLPVGSYNKHSKPYWTAEVKAAHQNQRFKRIEWIKQGRPRNSEKIFYKSYKEAKGIFRKVQKEAINNFELKYYSDLNESAECDVRVFWQLVNKRRKVKSSMVNKLKIGQRVANDPEEISQTFADHFSCIYIPKDHASYDNTFKSNIENKLKSIDNNAENNSSDLVCPVELCELLTCLKDLKKRKSPGADNITNEHIIHGGPPLLRCLRQLYSNMFEVGSIPDKCKVGIIIPIHKPGKSRDSPDSYRPITLLSAIYKLFERVFLKRLQHWTLLEGKHFPNPQQNAYQKHLGALTVSFNLQETISHNTELNSDTYAASLDSSKAFDHVWHDGLFVKLFDFGISGKALNLIRASYQNLSSYVFVNGHKSRVFAVRQGVRQGGVTSTWYYLLFIDGLLQKLENSGTGCTIGFIRLGNPVLADDIVLIGPSLKMLRKALAIVKEYASQWRFLFNPDKCHLIVFSPSRPPTNLSVEFGHSNITQKESITHVGIELHQSLKSSLAIDARIKKGRASLFSLLAIDRETGFVSPSILASLVEKICFPIVLYGAELWHNMSSADIYKLEKFMRLAAKSIQRFPSRTRTDMALGMLGWLPMMSYVEQRKLLFLQNLCTMPPNLLPRKVFNFRLNLFVLRENKNQSGFIPDIWKVLQKYHLEEYLLSYLATSLFPTKGTWKTIVKQKN